MQPIMMFVGNLGYAAVALSGGLLAIRGTITIGDIQAFIQYVKNFTQPMQQIAQVLNQVQSMAAASERVFAFLEEEEEVPTEHPIALPEQIAGTVSFQHVSFGYQPEQQIIHDFSADVQSGQKIAIVGPTGAGKTTMVKLLMRFYDVNSGAILLDGHNVKDFERHDLRKAFGMVLQDTWLFQGTIMEKYPLWQTGCNGRRSHCCGKGSPCGQLYPPAAGRLPDGIERRCQQCFARTEAAAHHCPCDSGR